MRWWYTIHVRIMIAPVRNDASRINVILLDLNGRMMPIHPDTTDTIKNAAPMSSPMASDPDPLFMALQRKRERLSTWTCWILSIPT
jgi:hypothetical protein